MNTRTRMLDGDDFFAGMNRMIEAERIRARRRRVRRVRRWLLRRAWREVRRGRVALACAAVWAAVAVKEFCELAIIR